MAPMRERLHLELQNLSEGYRNLPPIEQDRQIDAGIAEFLDAHYDELRELIRGRLTHLPPVPGKDDSWSW